MENFILRRGRSRTNVKTKSLYMFGEGFASELRSPIVLSSSPLVAALGHGTQQSPPRRLVPSSQCITCYHTCLPDAIIKHAAPPLLDSRTPFEFQARRLFSISGKKMCCWRVYKETRWGLQLMQRTLGIAG